MKEIDCTCASRTCYSCRRQLIDDRAREIIAREMRVCAGMNFDVEAHAWAMAADWRAKAITALYFESCGWS